MVKKKKRIPTQFSAIEQQAKKYFHSSTKVKINQKSIPYLKQIGLATLVNLVVILLIFIFRRRLPPELPVFYGLPEGENQLGNRTEFLIPSLFSLAIIFFNTSLSLFIKDDFIKKTLILCSLLIFIICLITTLKVVFLVGSF